VSDLEKKLHDIFYEQAKSYYFEGSSPEWFEEECPELIKKVKQAFIDAGWFTPADKELVQEIVNNRAQQKIDQRWVGPNSITSMGPLQPPDVEYDPAPKQLTGEPIPYDEIIKQNIRLEAYKAVDAYLDNGGPSDLVVMSMNDWERNAKAYGFMTGQEWLSKTLHVFYDHQNDRSYFRDGKQFNASTITMAEVESLLQKAAGVE
jgi:hypothetical protein